VSSYVKTFCPKFPLSKSKKGKLIMKRQKNYPKSDAEERAQELIYYWQYSIKKTNQDKRCDT